MARFSLATSGVMHYPMADLPVRLEDIELSGPSWYGYEPLQQALAVGERAMVVAEKSGHMIPAEQPELVLVRLGDVAPVIVVVEDLQWAGAAAVELLRHLVERATESRILILARKAAKAAEKKALRRENSALKEVITRRDGLPTIVGTSGDGDTMNCRNIPTE